MEPIIDSELWDLLSNPASRITPKELDVIERTFIMKVQNYCRKEHRIAERARVLHFTRSRLTILRGSHIVVLHVLEMIDCELELLHMEAEHPEQFTCDSSFEPLARWGGNLTDLIEYIIGPQAAGLFQNQTGRAMEYHEVVDLFGRIFGIEIANAHDYKAKVLDRQNNTKFQDSMRQRFLHEAERRCQ